MVQIFKIIGDDVLLMELEGLAKLFDAQTFDYADNVSKILRDAALRIDQMSEALDEIQLYCTGDDKTSAKRDGRWAAEVARNASNPLRSEVSEYL